MPTRAEIMLQRYGTRTLIVKDDADPTKQMKFNLAAVDPDETITVTLPGADFTVVAHAGGDGALAGATVTAVEQGDGVIHRTVLTLASTPVSVVSVTTGAGVGGTKVYDFPAGRIAMIGGMADLTLAIAAAKQADFTDATPEGDVGIGSAAPANADALGTDATDDNMATATAFTMSAYAATVKCPSENLLQFDGTSAALDAYVNALVDAVDIDDGVTTEVLVSGTITLTWINLGDF